MDWWIHLTQMFISIFGEFSIPVFFLFLLFPRRYVEHWQSQKGFKNQKEWTLNKQTDGNNRNITEARAIHSLKNVLGVSHKYKLSSVILDQTAIQDDALRPWEP